MLNMISSSIISCVLTAIETKKKIMKKMEETNYMEMKEMVYSENFINSELLYHEDFGDGTALAVVNNSGANPCAYIQFPGIDSIYDYDEVYIDYDANDNDTCVHGGFTFLGRRSCFGLDGFWIGWDYAHYSDYISRSSVCDGKKWTTKEIVEEARRVLRYFREGKWHEEGMEEDEELTCPCCGAPIGEDWNFCNKCGTKLS